MSAQLNRRRFLANLGGIAAGAALAAGPRFAFAAESRRPKILLRSSWQTVNIGDIAHTPGVLRLLEDHVPEADVTLWPSSVDNGVEEMLLARFPKLKIAKGEEAVQRAIDTVDVQPTITAHPTEAVRRSLLDKEQVLVKCLIADIDRQRTPAERDLASMLPALRQIGVG